MHHCIDLFQITNLMHSTLIYKNIYVTL